MAALCRNGHDKEIVGRIERDGACKECARIAIKRYMQSPKGSRHCLNRHLRNRYGITIQRYEEMFAEQQGKCAICGIHQDDQTRRMSVDHNHDTDKVRGLLCHPCNSRFGWLERNKSSVFAYLERDDG